jgi:hypothetical protein
MSRLPASTNADWARALAETERDADERVRKTRERASQTRQRYAQAAAAMLVRLHALFDGAAAAFNEGPSPGPVDVSPLKGGGFVVSRDARRLTVLKTSDWNVIFSFSAQPKIDDLALLSRVDGDGIGWRLYRKAADNDRLEPVPREPRDLADVVVQRLFRRLVHPARGDRR